MEQQNIPRGTRLAAMILDHVTMSFILILFFIPDLINMFGGMFRVSHEPMHFDFLLADSYLGLLGFAVYFCKDTFNGRSIAKRATGLQVVDANNNPANPLRCLVRNLFLIIWPVEFIIAMINPEKRLGDVVAGTRLVPYNKETTQRKTSLIKAFLALALSYGIFFAAIVPFWDYTFNMSGHTTYIPESINPEAADKLEEVYADSLGDFLSADVRIYDRIKEDEDLRYISVILYLKENYMSDASTAGDLKEACQALLYSRYPRETFVGQIQYIYKTSREFHSNADILDERR